MLYPTYLNAFARNFTDGFTDSFGRTTTIDLTTITADSYDFCAYIGQEGVIETNDPESLYELLADVLHFLNEHSVHETGLVTPFEVTEITVTEQRVTLTLTGEVDAGEEEVLIIADRYWEE